MCFSAEASFTAAALLGGAGIITLRSTSTKPFFLLASIPILFALQQFSEGILWLNLTAKIHPPFFPELAAHSFLFFAFFLWPVWIPLSLLLPERNKKMRMFIFVDLMLGIALSITNLFYALNENVAVEMINHSIQYTAKVPPQTYIYPFIVLIPCFLSTLQSIRSFAVLITIAYGVALYFYGETFVSVWCFFSALVSLLIYKVIRENEPEIKNSTDEIAG